MSSMKYRILSMVLLFMLLISFSAYAINITPEETYNSVVVVYTETGVGSGFSIRENLIITNAHVVGNNKNVAINLYDDTTIKGKVVKSDIEKDLALIKIEKSLAPLNTNEENINIGQEVYVIGAPKDMPYTMTKGIISALDRKLGQNTYIQIDASVNSGNSGGPLVDDSGNVIGIITLKANDAEGIGFALKASEILAFVDGAENTPNDNTVESDPSKEKNQEEKNADLIRLTKENEILKITVIILSVLLVLSLLINIKIRVKKKEKDEFDFEIEIEE